MTKHELKPHQQKLVDYLVSPKDPNASSKKTFESIRKETGMDAETLKSAIRSLRYRGLLVRVEDNGTVSYKLTAEGLKYRSPPATVKMLERLKRPLSEFGSALWNESRMLA